MIENKIAMQLLVSCFQFILAWFARFPSAHISVAFANMYSVSLPAASENCSNQHNAGKLGSMDLQGLTRLVVRLFWNRFSWPLGHLALFDSLGALTWRAV